MKIVLPDLCAGMRGFGECLTFVGKEMVSSYLTVLPGTDGAYKYSLACGARRLLKLFVG
jgi:hypothetical protein